MLLLHSVHKTKLIQISNMWDISFIGQSINIHMPYVCISQSDQFQTNFHKATRTIPNAYEWRLKLSRRSQLDATISISQDCKMFLLLFRVKVFGLFSLNYRSRSLLGQNTRRAVAVPSKDNPNKLCSTIYRFMSLLLSATSTFVPTCLPTATNWWSEMAQNAVYKISVLNF